MNLSKPLNITLATERKTDGLSFSCSSDAHLRVESVPETDAEVLYVTAKAVDAFFPCLDAIKISYAVENAREGVAIHRYSSFWCRPVFFGSDIKIPSQTQEALIKHSDGGYSVLLPLVGDKYRATLEGARGVISVILESYNAGLDECVDEPALILCRGSSPYELFDRAAKAACSVLGDKVKTVDKKTYPEIFEYLGWCTWDAMNIHVNAEGVREKLREIKEKDIPIRWAILDDMWADVKEIKDIPLDASFGDMVKKMHAGKLYSYKADPERFPEGLEGTIKDIHDAGLLAGVWYPATGYWSGFAPEGDAAKEFSDCLFLNDGKLLVSPERERSDKFYGAVAKYMKACGADFIKVDNQSCYRGHYIDSGYTVGEAAESMVGAIVRSAKTYFNDSIINCMGMANEVMFNRGDSCVSRCSNDFLPNDRSWFSNHITQCAYNSLLQGRFFVNDWDMWWTSDPQGIKNSVCRAISGGPVYVSDKIGETSKDVLLPLCFDDGRVIRTEESAKPTLTCLTSDPTVNGHPMMITSSKNGCYVVAAFNIDKNEAAVKGAFSLSEFGLDSAAVYAYFSDKLIAPDEKGKIEVCLKTPDDFELYMIAPYESDGSALLGIKDKFIMPGTFEREGDKIRILCDGDFVLARDDGKLTFIKAKKGDLL